MAKFFFSGDIVNKFNNSQFIDYSLKKIIEECDYAVCNLEGVVRHSSDVSGGVYQLPSTISSLKQAGFNLLLLSNNHVTDWGIDAYLHTISSIINNNLSYVGAGCSYDEVYKPFVVTIQNASHCFINICEAHVGHFQSHNQKFGYAWMGDKKVIERIQESSRLYDYTIVLVHAGLEHYDLPLASIRNLYRDYCDAGADCVIATHPHISQGIERYREKLIFYSLGNFFFPRTPNATDTNPENLSFSIIIDFSKKGISYSTVFHKTNNCVVTIDDSHRTKERLNVLNNLFSNSEYEEREKKQVEEAYNRVISTLFKEALNTYSIKDSIKTKCHNIIKYLFYKEDKETLRMRQKLLLRLYENETYRFLITEYLRNKILEK